VQVEGVKKFRAIIEANDDAPQGDENIVALLRLEMVFAIGQNSPVPSPESIVKSTISDLYLTGFVTIKEIKEID
jgi:hypothetical protein